MKTSLEKTSNQKNSTTSTLSGAGMGFRRDMIEALQQAKEKDQLGSVDFFEVSPENWMGFGGRYFREIQEFSDIKPFVAHGLSLSLGSIAPLDIEHLKKIKQFLTMHHIDKFTEHLSWCSDDSHLYDLLPIPLTEDAVKWVASRIKQTQDLLERQIGIENASVYFTPKDAEMSEPEFVNAVLTEANCYLHLDVNNVYVNSQNFGFDPYSYIDKLPLDKVGYIHVAGHYIEEDGFIIDTHGADVIDPVWELLAYTFQQNPKLATTVPTCLERDFNFPALEDLIAEVNIIHRIQAEKSYNALLLAENTSKQNQNLTHDNFVA